MVAAIMPPSSESKITTTPTTLLEVLVRSGHFPVEQGFRECPFCLWAGGGRVVNDFLHRDNPYGFSQERCPISRKGCDLFVLHVKWLGVSRFVSASPAATAGGGSVFGEGISRLVRRIHPPGKPGNTDVYPVWIRVQDFKFIFGSGQEKYPGVFNWVCQHRGIRFFHRHQVRGMGLVEQDLLRGLSLLLPAPQCVDQSPPSVWPAKTCGSGSAGFPG